LRAKTLSQANRLILIKLVAATIPSYAMSSFLLPSSLSATNWINHSRISGGVFLLPKPETFPSNLWTLSASLKLLVALVSER
jgi:hypothetical protein